MYSFTLSLILIYLSVDASPDFEIGRLSTHDPDTAANCLLQYSMPNMTAEKFSVVNGEKILTKASLDREKTPQYVFYITVQDCGSPPLTDNVRVTIAVSDVNDNNPIFAGPYYVDMPEDRSPGSGVVQVKATGKRSEVHTV